MALELGFNFPSNVDNVAVSGSEDAWVIVSGVKADDGVVAGVILSSGYSDDLYCTNFGFSVPSTGTIIKGIEIRIDRCDDNGGILQDDGIQLLIPLGGTGDPVPTGDNDRLAYWPECLSPVTGVFGGSSDLWGLDDILTPAIISASGFGMRYRALGDFGGFDSASGSVDDISIKVFYVNTDASGTDLFVQGYGIDSGNIPLFIHGYIPDSGFSNLFIQSHLSDSGNATLFIEGIPNNQSGQMPLFIDGYLPNSGNVNLFIDGIPNSGNSNIPLTIIGRLSSSDNIDLFMASGEPNPENDSLILLTAGYIPSNSNIDLFASGAPNDQSGVMDLFIAPPIQATGTIPLFMSAPEPSASSMLLYLLSFETASSGVDLFASGIPNDQSERASLFTEGMVPVSGGFDLATTAMMPQSGSLNLFIGSRLTTVISNIPLFTTGTPSGINGFFATSPLFELGPPIPESSMPSTSGWTWIPPWIVPTGETVTDYMNLFIEGLGPVPSSGEMNLFLKNTDDIVTKTLNLVLFNDTQASSIPLFIQGLGPTSSAGAIPNSGSMNLFINRVNTVAIMPLFLEAIDTSSTKITDLFVTGGIDATNDVTLAMPSTDKISNNNIILYSHGF